MGDDCAFCRIAGGDEDVHIVYEDGLTAAFLDRNPTVEGHTLIVPKAHLPGLVAMDEETAEAIFRAVRTVAVAMDGALDPDGVSVFHTTGSLVGNVEHAHVHLLPRYEDDPIRIALSRRPLAEGERVAARIRDNL